MKTNRILAAALTALCAVASGSAFAQTSFSVTSLPSNAIIDSVASNGRILYEVDAQTNSQVDGYTPGYSTYNQWNGVTTYYPAQTTYLNTGTQTYFMTGANGVGATQIAQAAAYAGLQNDTTTFLYYQDGGTNPLGAVLSSPPSVIASLNLQINSSGSAIGSPNSEYTSYAEVNLSGSTTTYGGPFDFNNDPLPSVMSNTGALAGASTGSSLTNTLYFWAAGSATTTPTSSTTLAGTVTNTGSNPYGSGLAISDNTNRVAGTIYTPATGLEQAFYSTANAHSVSYIPTSAANEGSSADTINDAGQVGGQLRYLTGGVLSETAFITSSAGAIVPIGVGAPGDDTETLFLNDSGQAILEDETSGAYYFYSGGTIYSVDSLFGLTSNDPVVGLTSSGGIVLADPGIYTPDFATLTGGTENSSTEQFKSYESYATPGGASVPAPTGAGLLGLGLLGLIAGVRARKQALQS